MIRRLPNLLFINCHDLGQHLGCYGIRTVHTPHLDALATEGVRFASSFCAAPQCSPSRAAMFTGRYPHANGVLGLVHKNFRWNLHPGERHLAALLREHGYRTALIGHQHETHTPDRCGWQEMAPELNEDDIAPAASACLRRLSAVKQPFYLQVGFHRPHRHASPTGYRAAQDRELGVTIPPYLVDEASAREDLAAFQGDIRMLDTSVGQILATLRSLGREQDTWVIFTADHGIPYPRAKCSLFDAGLETALLMRWPAAIRGGRVLEPMVSNVDYVPTILDVLRLPQPPNLHGHSFTGLLMQSADFQPRSEIFGEITYHDYYDPRRCIRTTTHKLILNFAVAPFFMNPSQQWRPKTITVDPPDPSRAYHPPLELYDLQADPFETKNLADAPPLASLQTDLLRSLHEWMRHTRDPLLQGPPPSPMHEMAMRLLAEAADIERDAESVPLAR